MNKHPLSQAVIASILTVTASSWAQTSVGLGRADFKEMTARRQLVLRIDRPHADQIGRAHV